jgi:glycosyltransferase involved in cell wall biosynthesis
MRAGSVLPTERVKILVFRSANVHQTVRALAQLRAKFQEAEISLLLPRHEMEYLADNPHVDRLRVYDNAQTGTYGGAIRLILGLRKERFDRIVILCPRSFEVRHLADAIVFSLLISANKRILLDGTLQETNLSFSCRMRAFIDVSACLVLSVVARPATRLALAFCPGAPRRDGIRQRSGRPERVGILVPILPDLSHTFVYREILAMIDQGVDCDVIALEEGDYGVLHPEAKALLMKAIVVQKISRSTSLLYYLAFLLTAPRRMAELIHLYRLHCRDDKLLFLRFEQFHNVFHPLRSLGLTRLLEKRGITYIHVYGSTYPATRAMVAASLLQVPFSISTFVDFDYESDFRMLGEKLTRATFVVAATACCASKLVSMTSEEVRHKLHTIFIGIDPDYGLQRVQRPAHSAPLIVAVGRLVEKKGFAYLLQALRVLKARGVFARCVLIGDGPEEGRLQAMAKEYDLGDRVTFTGVLPNEKVLDYLEPENILVAPSVYAGDGERDGIPTVLLEALMCKMAVVSTRISGIPELIEDQWNGILVPARDERALTDAIQKLLENPGLRKEYGLRGAEKVRAEFNVYKSSRKLWSLIDQSIKGQEPESN